MTGCPYCAAAAADGDPTCSWHRVTDLTLHRSPAVCRRAGITYRQLDYWVRSGVVTVGRAAHGSGSTRLFTEAEAADVAAVAALVRCGFTLDAVRALSPDVREALLDAVAPVLAPASESA